MKRKLLSVLISSICFYGAVSISTVQATTVATSAPASVLQNDFEPLRLTWESNFLGDPAIAFDESLKKMVVKINASAKKLLETSTDTGWADLVFEDKSKSLGPNIRTFYQRMLLMAKAYRLRGGELEGNKELLNTITHHLQYVGDYYKVDAKQWGNWWHWELGVPRDLNNLLTLLYNDLPQPLITSTLAASSYFVPVATHLGMSEGAKASTMPHSRKSTGGNRTDNVQIVLVRAILEKNPDNIKKAVQALDPILKEVTVADGFYSDGGFVQHYDIAYNGTYGNVLLGGLGRTLNLVTNSPWKANADIYSVLSASYIPLLYRGAMLDMFNGRAISRPKEQGHDVGHLIINSLLLYVDMNSHTENQQQLKAVIKHLIKGDTSKNFFSSIKNINSYQKAASLVNDDKVAESEQLVGNFAYPSIDRVVHRRANWVFGVAMHSSRIGNYECMNKENRQGWFTGDGMTYLYNNQVDHYTDFWPVVNNYLLEGITVNDTEMEDCAGQRNKIKKSSQKEMLWSGMTSNGEYGVAGMEFDNWNNTLQAKKSWFMLENEVVMLGSNISSSTVAANTVISNRKLLADSNILVNGKTKQVNGEMRDVSSISIHNTLKNSDISYRFFKPVTLTMKIDERSGDWADIGTHQGKVSATFFTALLKGKKYAYSMHPSSSTESHVRIIQNNKNAHVIYDKSLDLLAMNVWTNDKVVISKKLTILSKMSLMIQGNVFTVSDPLQTQSELKLMLKAGVKINDKRVTVEADGTVTVNVAGLAGKSHSFKVSNY